MRAHVIKDGKVVNTIEVAALDALPALALIDADLYGGSIGDLWDGAALVRPAPVIDPQQLQAEIVSATQARLDAFAQLRGYDGILSACTYANSTVAKFQAEGQYCVNARDATWAKLYAILADVQAGARTMPRSYADIEPELPALVWPA